MGVKRVLEFVQDGLNDATAWGEVSFTRRQVEEIIEALRKATQWQPMETAPKDRDIVAEVITDDGYVYKVVLSFDKHPALTDVWTSECSSFKHGQILRWKEVE